MTSTADDTGAVARGPRLDRRRSARTQGGRRGRLTVYLTDAERALLEARAEVSGESMAKILVDWSQCTYRCVVLPDRRVTCSRVFWAKVSMHLQVRGAP